MDYLMGYNFGCMIASNKLFDSRGWIFGVRLSECLRVVSMATSFGTKIAITSFVRMIVTRQLVVEGGLSGQLTEFRYCQYLAHRGHCHGNQFLAFCIRGAHWRHLVNMTEPSVCVGNVALCQITLTTCYYYY